MKQVRTFGTRSLSVALSVVIMVTTSGCNSKPQASDTDSNAEISTIGYETLFETSKVHTIDIQMDDFDTFIANASSKEYSPCTVVIDKEVIENVGIRGKGNYSMRIVEMSDSDRHSFKVEFDHYDKTTSYHGLDKLSLNNINQDNTYMKDYLSYELMRQADVPAPLCSYIYVTVNGEDWGLYLATEGVEESFIERNFENAGGKLYKPDSSAGGWGGGHSDWSQNSDEDFDFENFDWEQFEKEHPDWQEERAKFWGMDGSSDSVGMNTDDVKLKYIDDNADSYPAIFDNAKSKIKDEDKARLIQALKALNSDNYADAVNKDEVIRYFVVHNFLCNDDSYTGSLIHNYYLYEDNGKLSMIPWDYNLAFATFGESDATERVNTPIDTPIIGANTDDRPMFAWIVNNAEDKETYHSIFSEFISGVDIDSMIEQTSALISDYVKKDPTKFCTYEEYENGVDTLKKFCELRTKSIQGQLSGDIPTTTEGQKNDSSALIDASEIDLKNMGIMDISGFGGFH